MNWNLALQLLRVGLTYKEDWRETNSHTTAPALALAKDACKKKRKEMLEAPDT